MKTSIEDFPEMTAEIQSNKDQKTRLRRHRIARTGLALATVVILAAACSNDNDDEASLPRQTTTTTMESTTTTTVVGERPTTTEDSVTTSPTPSQTTAPAPDCSVTQNWNTRPESESPGSVADLYNVRVGQHECFDRIAFDVNGIVSGPEEVGFDVRYVPGEVAADASGEPVPTVGAVALQIVVRAPAQGYNPNSEGHQPGRTLAPGVGYDFYTEGDLQDWETFNEVSYAGSFEGQTTFAIGLDEQRDFAVDQYEEDGRTHVYVDIEK
jgi:hypothetical protein